MSDPDARENKETRNILCLATLLLYEYCICILPSSCLPFTHLHRIYKPISPGVHTGTFTRSQAARRVSCAVTVSG